MSHKQKNVGPTSSRVSPPLGALPSQPDSPEVQLPPPEPDLPPIQAVPMTDGTPAACMQKNAKEFLAGNTPGVMAQYAPGLFSTEQKRNSRQPAPDDPEAVKELVRLRVKCFHPLRLFHQERKHCCCQQHTAQQIEYPC